MSKILCLISKLWWTEDKISRVCSEKVMSWVFVWNLSWNIHVGNISISRIVFIVTIGILSFLLFGLLSIKLLKLVCFKALSLVFVTSFIFFFLPTFSFGVTLLVAWSPILDIFCLNFDIATSVLMLVFIFLSKYWRGCRVVAAVGDISRLLSTSQRSAAHKVKGRLARLARLVSVWLDWNISNPAS